ncbi:MAG: hypothetical protein HQL09_03710 [Nitrospirae bacterium]|nr:hypothetical protein [Nitrospirota bacterium]
MFDKPENGLIEGIAPKKISHESPVTAREFKPWHKPRKQWVRNNQWLKEIKALIPHLRLDGRSLRYLSLPGEDMLDIRVLAHLCNEKGLQLKCLGFDEEARDRTSQTEVNISRNEISNNIQPGSVIVTDNISVLKSTDSQGFNYIRGHGPFDIVNLDLCGSISCINFPDNHQVLHNLCEYQINNSREKWLLFLTTRAEYEQVNVAHLPHYLKCLKNNSESNSLFGQRLVEMSNWDFTRYNESVNVDEVLVGCRDREFVKLFAAGFGKWLIQLFYDTNNNWLVEMLDSCWYRVENNQTPVSFPNMLSLAFLFSPVNVPINDKSGLSLKNPEPHINEQSLAMGILDQTERFRDIDQEVDADPHLWSSLVEENAILLKTARYQVDLYPQWAEEKRIRFDAN